MSTQDQMAVSRAIDALDPAAQLFADKLVDRVTVIVGESQLLLMDEVLRLRAEHERMKEQMGRIVVQVEGLRQDVEALLSVRMVGA